MKTKLLKLSTVALAVATSFVSNSVQALTADDVVCNKCIEASDISAGAISTGKLRNGAVTAIKLADKAVIRSKIAPGAVNAFKIADGAVIRAKIANAAINSAKIANGTILYADTNVDSVQRRVSSTCAAGSSIRQINSNGTVSCETDSNSTYFAGEGLQLNFSTFSVAAETITTHIMPTACHRAAGSGLDALADTGVANPDSNTYGPSILINNGVTGFYDWHCSIPLPHISGRTITLTGAKLAFTDTESTCIVGAELRYKTFGTQQSNGTVFATVWGGTSGTDYASTFSGPQLKVFPVFSQTINSTQIAFVIARLNCSGGAPTNNVRYSGIELTYTVTP